MNTRLQVEHPVTELVTGLDLVRLQLLVAAGEPLPAEARLELDAIPGRHAIEVRLYAEDAAGGFLPQTGTVHRLEFPGAGRFTPAGPPPAASGVRLDSGVEGGSVVSPHYDPMLAKVIAWAPSRREAAALLAAELATAEVHGLTTNRDFLVRVLRHPAFVTGETDTGFLERHDGLAEPLATAATERLHATAAVLAETVAASGGGSRRPLGFVPPGWRNNFSAPQTVSFEGAASEFEIAYRFTREGVEVGLDGDPLQPAKLHSVEHDGPLARVDLEIDSVRRSFRVHRDGEMRFVNSPLGQTALRELPRFPDDTAAQAEGALVAPMPGKVIRVGVEAGQTVAPGEVIAVLEAMKMEHELTAGAGGSVSEVHVSDGDQVEAGAVIAVIETD
jgi:propionyl-CoA carboxylase alpha chain